MERIIQADIIPEDDKIEQGCGQVICLSISDRRRQRRIFVSLSKLQKNVASRSIMCCCMVLRDSVKQHWHRL